MTTPSPNTANRLALGLMAARNISYEEATDKLQSLTLRLVCDDQISSSVSLQAALLTAVNCGHRSFLGGVHIDLPSRVSLLLPWPGKTTLNEVVEELGAVTDLIHGDFSHTIYMGFKPADPVPHSLILWATSWRGGIEPTFMVSHFQNEKKEDSALGGIFAAGLAVHRGFLRASGISVFACDESVGVSLWNLEMNWLSSDAEGPALRALPAGLWLLGLGHLGQAFLWALGLLPFSDPSECELMLQDFDSIEEANVGAGLLCGNEDIGKSKTRVCSKWLEKRGFKTKLCERPFDETTHRLQNEPAIALCGFDQSKPRRLLEDAGFIRVLECGLGGSLNDFDLIHLHNFPGCHAAKDTWKDHVTSPKPNVKLIEALSPPGEVCGALALETAGKSVSTSFIGAMASALVFGELLRAFHKGTKYDEVFLSPRNMQDNTFRPASGFYSTSEIAKTGFTGINKIGSCE